MISNDQELQSTMERITRFQQQVMRVRETATAETYEASTGGFLAEIDRMMLDVREYLWQPPPADHQKTRAAA